MASDTENAKAKVEEIEWKGIPSLEYAKYMHVVFVVIFPLVSGLGGFRILSQALADGVLDINEAMDLGVLSLFLVLIFGNVAMSLSMFFRPTHALCYVDDDIVYRPKFFDWISVMSNRDIKQFYAAKEYFGIYSSYRTYSVGLKDFAINSIDKKKPEIELQFGEKVILVNGFESIDDFEMTLNKIQSWIGDSKLETAT